MSNYELTPEQQAEAEKEITEEFGKDIADNIVDEDLVRQVEEEYQKLKEEAEFDLDAALDTYDPTFPRYTPSEHALEFFNLMRLVQGQDFEFNTPIAHYFMADLLLGSITDVMQFPYSEEVCKTIELDTLRVGFMASRGMAKSTVVISFFTVYSAIKGELPNGIGKVYFYLLIAASSKGGARVNALAVRAMCEDSKFLQEYFEEMRFTETESEFVRRGTGPRKNRSFLIRYQGYSTGIRGSRYGERRPDCHVRGTKVTTEYGTYNVEDHPGNKSEGHWEYCKEVAVRGLPNKEIVSDNHMYWTKLDESSTLEPRWTKASELTDRHWIGSHINHVTNISEIKEVTNNSNRQVHIENGLLWRQVKEVTTTEDKYELIPIQCNNTELEKSCGTVHAYSTEFGISKNCIIFDDAILNTAAAYSKVISENLDEIIHSDAINALKGGGKGRVLLCFTPFHYSDVNTKALLQGAFTQCVIPIAKMFEAENTLQGKDITSSWEAMHPAKAIASLIRSAKKAKKLKGFMQERMLRLTSGSERLVPDSCIQWYDLHNVVNRLDYYNVYITTDYTTTSGETSDFSGIASWAISNNEDWFLLNLTLRKRGMAEQYNDTLEEAARWKRRGKYVEIGVETDGNQGAHVHSLEQEMLKRGDFFSFAKQKGKENSDKKGLLSRNTGVSKHERFRIAVSQVMLPKKMWFPNHLKDTPDMEEFLTQIKGATHEAFTRADDGPDLITQGVVTMKVIYPSDAPVIEDNKLTQAEDGVWGTLVEDEEEYYGGSTVF